MSSKKNQRVSIAVIIGIIILLNVIASFYFERFDLTENKRYTLSSTAKNIVENVEEPIIIDVYLKGEFPSEYKRLQRETRYLLEEFSANNSQIKFNFINPLADGGDAQQIAERFYRAGMIPKTLNVYENGKTSESILFPWAVAMYKDQSVKINLLKRNVGDSQEETVNNSVEQLEYIFADAFNKLVKPRSKKIAVMRGNGELPDAFIADFIKDLREYYYIAPFTLDSVAKTPQQTLQKLKEFDLILEAKPTEKYTEEEKYVLDQYLLNGGKALWLAETVNIEKDSLFNNPQNSALAYPKDLNLTDFFFKYGIRINPSLVNDINSAPLILASGSGNQTEFNPYPWFYSPLAISDKKHPIVNNIEAVKFDFANPIDTLKNSIKKTVLLSSSPYTKVEGTPLQLSLDIIEERPNPELYKDGPQPLAVLLEGKFSSVYENRIKPFPLENEIEHGKETKMLVISDGNVIKNEFSQGKPKPLGYDRYTGNTYGNKEFLMNAVNYMLDDTGLVDIRSKEVKLAFLNTEKIEDEKLKWQLINILLPLVFLGIFAIAFFAIRKRKYVK